MIISDKYKYVLLQSMQNMIDIAYSSINRSDDPEEIQRFRNFLERCGEIKDEINNQENTFFTSEGNTT